MPIQFQQVPLNLPHEQIFFIKVKENRDIALKSPNSREKDGYLSYKIFEDTSQLLRVFSLYNVILCRLPGGARQYPRSGYFLVNEKTDFGAIFWVGKITFCYVTYGQTDVEFEIVYLD